MLRHKGEETGPMKPAPFVYHAPRTVAEAVAILAEVAPHDGRVLAGGQSLVPAMALRAALPRHLVDINGVVGLDGLRSTGSHVEIEACVRHAVFERDVVDGPLGDLLATVVRHIAHYPIRTRGTFCGSVAHADPASEWCLVAATLDAAMIAVSVRNKRAIPAADYFRGVMTTALAPDELLTSVQLPHLPPGTRFGFYELNRRAGDFAMAMALATYRVEGDVVTDARIGVGAIEAYPRRIGAAEAALVGRAPDAAAFETAAAAAAGCMEPLDSDADANLYKRELCGTAVRRALQATTGAA
jgi:carbon-monoxide dehydrogenase medium subunit